MPAAAMTNASQEPATPKQAIARPRPAGAFLRLMCMGATALSVLRRPLRVAQAESEAQGRGAAAAEQGGIRGAYGARARARRRER